MIMNPRVRKVIAETGRKLRITFTNGEVRVFDVGPLLDRGVFRELKDESVFRSVHPWHGTVQWSGGQDICPDTLYEESMPLGGRTLSVVREPRVEYRTKRKTSKQSKKQV